MAAKMLSFLERVEAFSALSFGGVGAMYFVVKTLSFSVTCEAFSALSFGSEEVTYFVERPFTMGLLVGVCLMAMICF